MNTTSMAMTPPLTPLLTPPLTPLAPRAACAYQLRFKSLFGDGRALSFPCSASGEVQLDELSDLNRANYFYARAVVGREFSAPAVEAH